MWAIAIKEFRQLRRDHRTLALMVMAPMLLLVAFGYAARFDVAELPTIVVGHGAAAVAARLPEPCDVVETRPGDRADAVEALRSGEAAAAVVTGPRPEVLVDYVSAASGAYPDLTVAENLAFAAAAHGAPPPALDDELAAVRDRLVGELPLGLQRRVAFAAASGHRPALLILDEPTSGVGPLGRARLWDDIRAAAERGVGVLVTTHSMWEAEQCDRLVVLGAGRVVAEGTLDGILAGGKAVVVRVERWQEAFRALRDGGFRLGLSGRSLRVVEAGPERVRGALAAAGLPAEIDVVPATFEEAFLVLSGSG